MLDSVLYAYETYHPQKFLEECKYKQQHHHHHQQQQQQQQKKNYIDEELKSESYTDIDNDTDNDNEG